jgi:hypothetical protein
MAKRLLGVLFFSFLSTFLYTRAASAFALKDGYPVRTNTTRVAPLPGSFDIAAINAGINRNDCLDSAQRWKLAVTELPADTTAVEIWARADGTSCAPAAERAGTTVATAPHCYRVAKWTASEVSTGNELELDNLSIIQAIDKKKNVDGTLDAKQVCARTEHMPPTELHLHVLAFNGSEVINVAESKPAEIDYVTLYDLAGPPAATGMTTGAGEGMITVKLKAPSPVPSDFKKYQVYCFKSATVATVVVDAGSDARDAGDAGDVKVEKPQCPTGHPFVAGTIPTSALDSEKCGESSSLSGDIVLDVKDNDTPYAIALAAIDKQDNVGPLSAVVCETPRATNSFWDNYNAAGGQAGGGCSIGAPSGETAMAAFIALAIVALCLRRRVAAPVAAALFFIAMPSRADDEAPSTVMMEARFGPYRPRVDSAFTNGRTPFRDAFGSAPRLMIGAEVDVTAFRIPGFGSVGFGGLVGYTSAKAKAQFADKSGTSDETTSFDLWVFSALTTVRIDVLARRTHVPLVPYGKLGLMTALWSSSDGHGVSEGNGREARGRTNGFLYAAGAMFLLDALDPEAAKTFAAEHKVKHSYVFGEVTFADLRGFGQTYPMRVGDLTWTAGLAFEM